jgi:hypothetical protein
MVVDHAQRRIAMMPQCCCWSSSREMCRPSLRRKNFTSLNSPAVIAVDAYNPVKSSLVSVSAVATDCSFCQVVAHPHNWLALLPQRITRQGESIGSKQFANGRRLYKIQESFRGVLLRR